MTHRLCCCFTKPTEQFFVLALRVPLLAVARSAVVSPLQGAEIIRLYHTLLGPEGFRKGTDLYFKRHDGQVRQMFGVQGTESFKDWRHCGLKGSRSTGTVQLAMSGARRR